MQGQLLFGPSPAPMPRKKIKKDNPKKRRARKVTRGKTLKRHPARPPAVKRVVATRPVRLQNFPDGPIGQIVESVIEEGHRTVSVKWEGRSKLTWHNPRFLVSVTEDN